MYLRLPDPNIESFAPHASPSVSTSIEAQTTQHSKAAAKAEQVVKPDQPFHQTPFRKLSSEIRKTIFVNLLATPPYTPSGRARGLCIVSHLAILRTCRQFYLEAFQNFYYYKSYYAANAQEFCHLLNFGHPGKAGPEGFRSNVVTTLCFRGLTVRGQISNVMEFDGTFHHNTQAQPPASREVFKFGYLDHKVSSAVSSLQSWTSLRKICLCMQDADECHILDFQTEYPISIRRSFNLSIITSRQYVRSHKTLGSEKTISHILSHSEPTSRR